MAYRETQQVLDRKQARHQTLLRSAEALVREGGFAALTMQAVANSSGMAVGTVYRYFPNKEALAAAVFQSATEREVAAVEETLGRRAAPAERLADAVRNFAERAFAAPEFAWALIAEPVDPSVDRARLRYRQRYTELFAAVIDEGVRAGQFVSRYPSFAAAALVGAMAESLLGPLKHPEQPQLLIAELESVCLRALGHTVRD